MFSNASFGKMSFSHIVAADQNGAIGSAGNLPWHVKEDLMRFKRLTSGHCLIMGRKTFDSIGKPLPQRFSVVLSRQTQAEETAGATFVPDLDAAIAVCRSHQNEYGSHIFIVGGGEVYQQTMPFVDRIYLTRIEQKCLNPDTFYPQIPADDFILVDEEKFSAGSFLTYQRNKMVTGGATKI